MQIILPRLLDEAIDQSKVEVSFCGFEELPVDGREHGVERDGGKTGTLSAHVFEARAARVVEFGTEHEKRFAAYYQAHGGPVLFEVRDVWIDSLRPGANQETCDHQPSRMFSRINCHRHDVISQPLRRSHRSNGSLCRFA